MKYTANLFPHTYSIVSDTVADGEYEFDIGKLSEPLPFFLDGFHFLDVSGAVVTPTAGDVTVTASSDGVLFRNMTNGSFLATADPVSLTPPNGQAPLTKLKITLSGVVGAVGFSGLFVKGGIQ